MSRPCPNCGTPLEEGLRFCPNCGAPISAAAQIPTAPAAPQFAAPPAPPAGKPSPNIELGMDGIYRWVYELNMFRNPTIFVTVLKVLGISLADTYLLVAVIGFLSDSLHDLEELWGLTWPFLLIALVFLVIGGIAYLLVAAMMGGKYVVLFEMTDTEIRHIQLPKQVKMGQAIGLLAALSGLASGNLTTVGLGLSTAARGGTSTSVFARVKGVRIHARRGLIKLNQALDRNQIYALPADFPFVASFILAHCPQAAVKQ